MSNQRTRKQERRSARKRQGDRLPVSNANRTLANLKRIALQSLEAMMDERQSALFKDAVRNGKRLLEELLQAENNLHELLKEDTLEFASERKKHFQQRLKVVADAIPTRDRDKWTEFVLAVQLQIDIEASAILQELDAEHFQAVGGYAMRCAESVQVFENEYTSVRRIREDRTMSELNSVISQVEVFQVMAVRIHELQEDEAHSWSPDQKYVARHIRKERNAIRATYHERLRFSEVDKIFNNAIKGSRWSDIDRYVPWRGSLI